MELFLSSHLSIPLFQVTLLLLLSTMTLLFGRLKLGLLINYCFTMYWGYMLNLDIFTNNGTLVLSKFTFAYLGFGCIIICLALIGFLTHRD
jgi:hypothetical protein